MPDMAKEKIDKALATGLDVAALSGLFAYFLYETPEGEKLRQEISHDWDKAVSELQEKKQLKGKPLGLREWLEMLGQAFRKSSQLAEVNEAPVLKKPRRRVDKSGRFRGV